MFELEQIGDYALPMPITSQRMAELAREIALDLYPLDRILSVYEISPDEFARIKENSSFQIYLASEIASWRAANNTPERIKLKAQSALEEWLPELYTAIHEKTNSLTSRIEGGKLLRQLAGMAEREAGATAEGIKVVINMGNGNNIEIEKNRTIDAAPLIDMQEG